MFFSIKEVKNLDSKRNQEDLLPGPWANFIFQKPCPFSVAVKHNNSLRGEILLALIDMPAVNEPTIRNALRLSCDAKQFFSKINQRVANVEAIFMYTVGVAITDKPLQCKHCRQGNGPFEYCVRVPGFMKCANCHWDKQGPRCSFNETPRPPKKSRRNNKLVMQEEVAYLDAKMVSFQSQLEAIHANRQDTLESNAESSAKSSDEIEILMPVWYHTSCHQCLRPTTGDIPKLQDDFDGILQKYRALMDRTLAFM
ncbi:hypothetical protein N7504_004461 [Penicillium tannophilum]|nr:hypothetical protein N7504_004461 [Penicillium tannophilum]